jgi:hypothetical protein
MVRSCTIHARGAARAETTIDKLAELWRPLRGLLGAAHANCESVSGQWLERDLRRKLRLDDKLTMSHQVGFDVPSISGLQFAFLAYNAAVGLVVGLLAALSPTFAGLGIPVFAWLILAMFVFELVAGFVLDVHPATAITMVVRVAAITISFLICFATIGYFQSA